jgi:hypothetical protein
LQSHFTGREGRGMILTSLQTSQLSDPAFEWYRRYLETFESRNIDAFLAYLAEDCVVQSNSRMPYYGRDSLKEPLKRYFEAYTVTHELLNIFGDDRRFGTEMLTHYASRRGEETIIVPTATFYDRDRDGMVQSMRHYVDDKPLSS